MARAFTRLHERVTDGGIGRYLPLYNRLDEKHQYAYKLLFPALAMMFVVHVIPVVWGATISVMGVNSNYIADWTSAPFVGLEHYAFVMDPTTTIGSRYWYSISRTVLWSVGVLVGTYVLGLTAALLLNQEFKGSFFVRTLLLLPWIAPAIVTLNVWRMMFLSESGIINHALMSVGLIDEPVFWLLGDQALWSMTIAHVWLQFPWVMIMLYAGLQSIPQQLYEAAAIDGAGRWGKFRYVTLPQLKPVSGVVVLLMLLWTMIDFTTPYVMFGGSPPSSVEVTMVYIYNFSFRAFAFGRGAAMSVGLFVVAMVLATIYYRRFIRSDLEEEDQ
ncbi:carbohydrate ABC transporter permease [Natrinema pallidum]|uniref:Sugar ABC transporter permease n=1 Tax=Natrinema pallidum TaxID=69527 RepID=A0A4P9TF17_9EURY|nr:sugar ABC transporter permease [Natrinema pallidum]QCW03396.1 sugar ABC transporter permease [Natrinema pallidum]